MTVGEIAVGREHVERHGALRAQLRQGGAQPLAGRPDQLPRLAGGRGAPLLDERRQLLVVVADLVAVGDELAHEGHIPGRAAEEVGPDDAELALDLPDSPGPRDVGVDVVAQQQHALRTCGLARVDKPGERRECQRPVSEVDGAGDQRAELVEALAPQVVAVDALGDAPHASSSA
jgi:hypothetical protein